MRFSDVFRGYKKGTLETNELSHRKLFPMEIIFSVGNLRHPIGMSSQHFLQAYWFRANVKSAKCVNWWL